MALAQRFAAVVLPVTIVLAIPFLLPSNRSWLAAAPLQSSLVEMKEWSVDLLAFVLPAYDHWLFGGMVRPLRESFGANPTLQTAYLGFTPIVLAALALRKAVGRAVRPWAWSALVFFAFALGPFLHVGGLEPGIPLPQRLVYWLPPLSGIRDMSMYVVPLMLALSILAAQGLSVALRCRTRLAGSAIAVTALALVLAEFAVLPFPLFAAHIPDSYRAIARDPDPVTVLELPISAAIPVYQYYQTMHGKPLLGGYLNRLHPWYDDFAESFPTMRLLKDPPDVLDSAESSDGADFLRFFRVRYVIVHSRIAGDRQSRKLAAFVRHAFPLQLMAEDDGTLFYRVEGRTPATTLPIVLDFSPEHPDPILKMGWAQSEHMAQLTAAWAEGTTSRLWVELPTPTSMELTLRVQPFSYPGATPQSLSVSVNGAVIGATVLPDAWSVQRFSIPRGLLLAGVNRIDFAVSHCGVPATVAPGSRDDRCLSVAFDFVRIDATGDSATAPR